MFCYDATELASPELVCPGIGGGRVAWKPEAQESETEQSRPGSRSMPHGGRHRTVGGPEVAMNVEVEQPPQSGKVSGCVAGGQLTPVQHCAEASLVDQHVTCMEVTWIGAPG